MVLLPAPDAIASEAKHMYSLLTYGATRLTESTHKTIFEACHKARRENRPAQVFDRRGALIYSYALHPRLTRVAKTRAG